MSYINFPNPTPIFPTLPPLTWSVHKKPIMASRATVAITGRETRVACAVYPRWAFILSYGGGNSWLRDQTQNIEPDLFLAGFTELQQLTGLFMACLGPYGEFYYLDPSDNSRANQLIGVGDGFVKAFDFFFDWGNSPYFPPFSSPVQGLKSIENVYINGTVQDPGSYTINANNTGIIFSTPVALNETVRADFHFYFRCSFSDDSLILTQFGQNLWDVKEVRFESVKP